MANPARNQPESTKVEFIQRHRPTLEAGEYRIQTIQTVQTVKSSKIPGNCYQSKLDFAVYGERFSLNPRHIHAVFPPKGSLGDHFNVMPHISFNRGALPWERKADHADSNDQSAPWLTLLLFTEAEKPTPQVLSLGQLTAASNHPKWPGLSLEVGQHPDDKVTVIDVAKGLLAKIMPAKQELACLTHVRQGTDDGGNPIGNEMAVIIGNRLPEKGKISTVHLVSVEGRYNGANFNYQGAGDSDFIRLATLQSWRFACIDERQSFTGLLTHINEDPSALRLPHNHDTEAETYLSHGFCPLPHELRQGGKTVSWYHGPLHPGENPDTIPLPVRAADQLVRYDPSNGMFDVSYAAAWELGRLLTLQNRRVSIDLYNWKRRAAQNLKQEEQRLLHLPALGQPITGADAPPESVNHWFRDLSMLKGAPFNYLAPNEEMLPRESIRFFRIDKLWVDCLLDGAFSVGRVTQSDHSRDGALGGNLPNALDQMSGFLLRSDVVSGWPGLLVDGYDETVSGTDIIPSNQKLPQLRMDRLSTNILICLFAGEVKTVDIHLKPETMHFGVDAASATHFRKELRHADGRPDSGKVIDPVPWKDRSRHVIDVNTLASDIKNKVGEPFTAAQFALQMVEGAQKVRFAKASQD